ncbi:hypothetical protein B0H63DRAFT_466771 [Podospora didyma]|uniref:Uncharacterized protein n=1 Tax=Podospora didyma TaxID=330526 RepID=A0AAE0P075_9PEZI|nr:hypothetical protein B0H63DRAFT_466771 [Podospora didyma]
MSRCVVDDEADYSLHGSLNPASPTYTKGSWVSLYRQQSKTYESVSYVYSALPAAIQSRVRPFGPLRQKVRSPWSSVSSSASTSEEPDLAMISGPMPVPDQSRTMSMADKKGLHPDRAISIAEREAAIFSEPMQLSAALSATPGTSANDNASGVGWKFGGLGLSLILSAGRNSRATQYREPQDCRYERQAYISGLKFILQGLPEDLDGGELRALRDSMPAQLADTLPALDEDNARLGWRRRRSNNGNFIHNSLLFILVYLNAWVRWFMPYIFYWFSELMRYEREHKVLESVIGTGMAAARAGYVAIRKMGDGVPGQFLSELFQYASAGVSGAFKEFAESELRNEKQRRY